MSYQHTPIIRRDFQRKELETAEAGPSYLRQVFVGGVSRYASENDILSLFESVGTVVAVRWGVDRRSKQFKGFLHVEYAKEADAIAAVELGGTDVKGQAIRVSRAREQKMPKTNRKVLPRNNNIAATFESKFNVVCLRCRQSGHKMANCPSISTSKKSKGRQLKLMCYNCGGNSHRASQCRRGKIGNGFTFAVCFICNQEGHLSSQCEQNTKGLYPNGGGCRICGDNKHLARNCPVKSKGSGKRKRGHGENNSSNQSNLDASLSGNYRVDFGDNAYSDILNDLDAAVEGGGESMAQEEENNPKKKKHKKKHKKKKHKKGI